MRIRFFVLLIVVLAIGGGAGWGVRHLVRMYQGGGGVSPHRDGEARPVAASPGAGAPEVRRPQETLSPATPTPIQSSEERQKPERYVTGVAWLGRRALVQWSDGEIYSSEDAARSGLTFAVTRTAAWIDGVRWPIKPRPVERAERTGVAEANFGDRSNPVKGGHEAADAIAANPDAPWETQADGTKKLPKGFTKQSRISTTFGEDD